MPKLNVVKIQKLVNQHNKRERSHYPDVASDFIDHATRYIEASKQSRVMVSIGCVAPSGMSRNMKFLEMKRGDRGQHNIYNFHNLFRMLGYFVVKDSDYFRIYGGGMDMVFHTHYQNIRQLKDLGFLTKAMCKKLEQKTPHVI
jgi:hypothetical protein